MTARYRAEDVRWLAQTGESLSGAARRLGMSPGSLEKWMTNHGMRAELEALRGHEPVVLSDRPRRGGRPEVPAPCGTERAYQRHYYRGEPVDADCAEAHRLHNRKASA